MENLKRNLMTAILLAAGLPVFLSSKINWKSHWIFIGETKKWQEKFKLLPKRSFKNFWKLQRSLISLKNVFDLSHTSHGRTSRIFNMWNFPKRTLDFPSLNKKHMLKKEFISLPKLTSENFSSTKKATKINWIFFTESQLCGPVSNLKKTHQKTSNSFWSQPYFSQQAWMFYYHRKHLK